jgi:UDP-glucose 4-epimerase
MTLNLLITGGNGFIGSHAVRALSENFKVQAPSRTELDLLDEQAVHDFMHQHLPDVVLHTATWNATRTSAKDPSKILESNLAMYFNLVRTSSCFGKLIHYGSGAEFDRRHWHAGMREEEFGLHIPSDAYGLSKYLIESQSDRFHNVWNLRLFGVYGPGEDWRIRFISNACCYALHGQPIQIEQDRVFDYTWVEDVVQITRYFIESDLKPRTVNLSAGFPIALSRLAEYVLDAAAQRLPILLKKPGMGPEYSGSNEVLCQILPTFTFTPIQEGVRRLYHHYSKTKDQIDPRLIR